MAVWDLCLHLLCFETLNPNTSSEDLIKMLSVRFSFLNAKP